MANKKNDDQDVKALSTDTPEVNDTTVTSEEAANTNVVENADTATTSGQDAAILAAVKDNDVLEPGDEGYDVNTDPVVPNSALAEIVASELAGNDGKSPTWDALKDQQKKDKE